MAEYSNIFARYCCLLLAVLTACTADSETTDAYHVVLRVDDVERVYSFTGTQTVAELLNQANLTIGEEDHLSHPLGTQLQDGLVVSIQRSTEWTDCVLHPIPNGELRLPNELLKPGETRFGPIGKLGIERVCSFFQIRNGETQQTEINREIIEAPSDQVIYYGIERRQTDIPITGTVAYLSHGTVWIMRGSSDSRRPISEAADADHVVFALAPDGESLLYTRRPNLEEYNRLWLLRSTSEINTPALQLAPRNVTAATWHPRDLKAIYIVSAGEDPTLQRHRLDLKNGDLQQEGIMHPRLASQPNSKFKMNGDGTAISYAQADEVGIYSINSGVISTFSRYSPEYYGDKTLWLPPLSWSTDDRVLITTLPAPTESQPGRFDIVVFFIAERIRATILANVGLMAKARYSPRASATIAYTQEDEQGYSLFIADRDGSNGRLLFPDSEKTDVRDVSEFAWSANGQQILAVADGNLWLIEVDSGLSWQLTGDGGIRALEWAP